MNALGLDAGGSSSKFAVVDASGAVLVAGRVAPFGGHLFDDAARQVALEVLDALVERIRVHAPDVAMVGVTGLGADSAEARWLEAALRERLHLRHCRLMNDMDLAYAAHFAPGAGILVYAGTGSIAYHLTKEGTVRRAGGRGYLIDDAGGGFWIGQRALRAVTRALDAGGLDSGGVLDDPLLQQISARIGSVRWEDWRTFVYGGGRSAVAGLAPLVGEAATAGSAEAEAILEAAGRELAALARRLQAQIGELPVTLTGGALLVSSRIEAAARESGLAFTRSRLDIAEAAARMALEPNNLEPDNFGNTTEAS